MRVEVRLLVSALENSYPSCGMASMPSFQPNGGQSLLVRDPIQESFSSKLPNTSRYAWPKPRAESSLSASSFPSRSSKNPFFARHNPHPQRVRHLKGLLDIPVCTVIDQPGAEEDPARFFVSTPTIDQMRQRPLKGLRMPINADAYVVTKERAIPTIGLVPITQTWRDELKKLTEATGLNKSQYTNTNAYQVPMSRQGSRQAHRPPPSRNGEIPPSRSGEMGPGRLESRAAERPSMSRHDRQPLQHIVPYPDHESMVLELLGQILQTDSLLAIQSWLSNAPNREKEIVLDMIRAVSSSDRQFREGYNEVVRSPTYDDQMLQQESSLEIDEIKKYNEEKQKESEEEERKKREEAERSKPRTSRSAASHNFTQYQWSSPGLKPSSPFIVLEKKNEAMMEQTRPRPGTAEAEIEEIRSRLQSRSSPRVFSHQRPSASRLSQRPQTQQSLYIPPVDALEPVAQRPPSHQSIKSQQSVIKSILSYKPSHN